MRQRGVTLVELLVAMALSLVVTLVLFSMMAGGLRLSSRFLGEESVIQQAETFAARLSGVVHETDLSLATYGPDFLAVPGARAGDGRFATDPKTGQPQWNQLLVVYAEQSKVHLRSLEPVGQVPRPLDQVQALRDGSGELLTDDLDELKLSLEQILVHNDPIAGSPDTQMVPGVLLVSFRLRYVDRQGRTRRFQFSDRLQGWNSFARTAPAILPAPTETPRPFPKLPRQPSDWN